MASEGYHEPIEQLDDGVIDRHRAIVSIMEELEAVDWYDQRASATADDDLKAVLAHTRDEEKEHAAMAIEWLRRNDETFDRQLRTYLFTDGPITAIEDPSA
jgi:ferritin-like protein